VIQSGAGVLISGQGVTIASGLNVNIGSGVGVTIQSGIFVNVGSGIGVTVNSGINVIISGQPITIAAPSIIRARLSMKVTDLSGGVTLASGGVTSVSLRSLDGDLWVGGSQGIEFPYSGYGMIMQQGDSLSIDAQNFNQISVVAIISGYRVAYIGQQ